MTQVEHTLLRGSSLPQKERCVSNTLIVAGTVALVVFGGFGVANLLHFYEVVPLPGGWSELASALGNWNIAFMAVGGAGGVVLVVGFAQLCKNSSGEGEKPKKKKKEKSQKEKEQIKNWKEKQNKLLQIQKDEQRAIKNLRKKQTDLFDTLNLKKENKEVVKFKFGMLPIISMPSKEGIFKIFTPVGRESGFIVVQVRNKDNNKIESVFSEPKKKGSDDPKQKGELEKLADSLREAGYSEVKGLLNKKKKSESSSSDESGGG